MKTNTNTLLVTLIVSLSSAVLGCERAKAASGVGDTSTANVAQSALAAEPASKVTKIVFVGKEHPCDCTRRTIDAGWVALQAALGTPAKLPVERLQIDTEDAKVEPYRKQKPVMALPAIYFVDGKGVVAELLQGEVTSEQIAGALRARRSGP
jgi:hypothetical protein